MAPTAKTPPKNAPNNASDAAGGAVPKDFESAMEELERIVTRMESGEMKLEDSLAAHRRGLELAQYCQAVLATAQQQVKVLEGDTLKALDEVGQQD